MLPAFLIGALAALGFAATPRTRDNFDDDWRFHLGHAADPLRDFGYGLGSPWAKAQGAEGAAGAKFDDGDWRQLNLPHDWVVEQPFVSGGSADHKSHGYRPTSRVYPESAIGWYRKTFTVPKSSLGRRLTLEFDGVFRNCEVWVNGHFMARNLSGYSGFAFDFSDVANYGAENVVAVRVDASQYEGWFYEGGGIYRHVWLVETGQVHIPQWGVWVRSDVQGKAATLTVQTELSNASMSPVRAQLKQTVIGPDGDAVATFEQESPSMASGSLGTLQSKVKIANPALWSLETPQLYRLKTEVLLAGKVVDVVDTPFGIRTIRFDKDKGFFLNGKRVPIQGTCNHQDHAGVGSALPDALQAFRVKKLKEMGCNAYRTSHNPPTPELLDECDRQGVLVMDENRLLGSSEEIMGQFSRLIRRDRNHPSVILWSLCNEEPEQWSDRGARVAKTMLAMAHRLDPTREVTAAVNADIPGETLASQLDIRGFNYYAICGVDKYRAAHPNQKLIGSEEASTLTTRGEYVVDAAKGYLTAYDKFQPGWGALAEDWMKFYDARPWLTGAFVWTGFDYRGEPTPYSWPCISSHFGILDTCGFPKDLFFYYRSWWTNEPTVHVLPHWNWQAKEGKPIEVWVFSNQEEIELRLNGKSIGRQTVPRLGHVQWNVPYEPGKLEAIGYVKGKETLRDVVQTTGAAATLKLDGDRSQYDRTGKDCALITVSAFDAEGRRSAVASNSVEFAIEGDAKIIGVGNGDPSCHEPDQYVASTMRQSLGGWRLTPLKALPTKAPSISSLKAGASDPFDVEDSPQSNDPKYLAPNSFGAYWTTFDWNGSNAGANEIGLTIGQIDDEGWVYLNGQELGTTKDWERAYRYDVSKLLKATGNELVVVVKNNGGPGGLGRGVSLGWVVPAAGWKRSLFNGYAQVIVQLGKSRGPVTLKATSNGLKAAELKL